MARRRYKEKNAYPCRQQELYDTGETAWNLFVLHIGDFTKFMGSYSTKFYEERMQDVEHAKRIKSRAALRAELMQVVKEMTLAKNELLFYYRCTKQYIKNMKPTSYDKRVYMGGTKSDYRKAANNNWSNCNGLKLSLSETLEKRKDDLMKDDNMPESFYNDGIAACKNFQKIACYHWNLKVEMKSSAQEKVKLNNIIYRDLTLMLNNSQFIYRNRKDMQQVFQFDKLLKTARKKKKEIKVAESKPKALSFLSKVAGMF